MKTNIITFNPEIKYDLRRIDDPEKILFFDIETTGLSARKDRLYLIGCVYLTEDGWTAHQWFAESEQAEQEILLHFLTFCRRFSTLVHFNGDTFDLPFLKERAEHYGISPVRLPAISFDIYKKTRYLKHFLSLPDCKQKTLEGALGIRRKDRYSGGELIDFYWNYLKSSDKQLLSFLLLHNLEDIENLPLLTELLLFDDLKAETFGFGHLKEHSFRTYPASTDTIEGREFRELLVDFHLQNLFLPCRYTAADGGIRLIVSGDHGVLRVPLIEANLKLFFPDPENYYYLPAEDQAIHKSIAEFVDKSARKKATHKTCYQNVSGIFIPLPENFKTDLHIFRTEYRSKPQYLLYRDAAFENTQFLNIFLLALLNH